MMFVLLFIPIVTLIYAQQENSQIIEVHINEELPLSTILFTTTNNITYRLFDSARNQNSFVYYNATNGHILLTQSLDREYLCLEHLCSCTQCQLTIELIEWQPPYRLFKLILNVEDVNDHTPSFSSDNYLLNIIENVPVGFELSVEPAVDADLGENSRIDYELNNHAVGPFELVTKSNGGLALRVIDEIDREKRDFYQYELIAYDHGKPKRQSSTRISIQVNDMNDNAVVLPKTFIQLHISENTPVGTELTYINATDNDIGLNAKIHYSISNGHPSTSFRDYFRIGDSNGILILINALDYESEQFFRLTIQVRDRGENSLARFATVDISIIDENDNVPQAFVTFVNPLRNDSIISIVENTPIGEILAHISITDKDSGANGEMSYKIEQGEELFAMKILDQNSYLLVINTLIDREDLNMTSNKLILIIYDHGKPSQSTRLEYHLEILDLNDSPPSFNPSTKCHVHLNLLTNRSLDEPLFQVQASDLDSDENGLVSYLILPPHENLFTINDRGEVFNVDYLNETLYYLQIMAVDHGKPIQLNSTYNCLLSTYQNNDSEYFNASWSLVHGITIFQYNYTYLFIIISICLLILTVYCFYKMLFDRQKSYKENKTYHLYVSVPRRSSYIKDEFMSKSQCDENHLEEHERLVQSNKDKEPIYDNPRLSRAIRNDSPSSTCSIMIPSQSPHELLSRLQQDSRPVSLSISTATTCTSTGTDLYCKVNNPNSTVVRLAEEEFIDV